MSLNERRKKSKKIKWGKFGGMWFPGFNNAGQHKDDDKLTPADVGGESVSESKNFTPILKEFTNFCSKKLGIDNPPSVKLKQDPQWSRAHGTFGQYDPESRIIRLSVANRHLVDIMRTLAHELTHHKQNEISSLPSNAGKTGSVFEDSANAIAGRIMREFAELHPEYFKDAPVVNESSGYIPVNQKEANDPRFAMALTQDVGLKEPVTQAAKLNFKLSPAGVPPTANTNGLIESLTRKLQVIKEGTESLFEIDMSQGGLQAFLNSPAAEGIMAGFEAELIFEGVTSSQELGPDYDEDRFPDSIDDIIDFFESGPYGELTRQDRLRITAAYEEEYQEWLMEQIDDEWVRDRESYIEEYIDSNNEFDYESAADDARDDLLNNNENFEELPEDEKEELIQNLVSKYFADFLEEAVEQSTREGSRIYEEAFSEYMDEHDGDYTMYDFFSEQDIFMSTVEYRFGLDWPYMTGLGEDFDENAASELADNLSRTLGLKTTVSVGYHSARRDNETWIFEPDSSLEPNDTSDLAIEIVSPPMPLKQCFEIMPKFFQWAKDNYAYANDSTGFHMGVSLANHEGDELDFTKLALLLGDEHVLNQFGRLSNTYTKSAFEKVKGKITPETAEEVLSKMKNGLSSIASSLIADSSGFGKYTSINPKSKYIEFRSAGGSNYFSDIDKIQSTLLRYARATSAAMNPEMDKQEYAKKLYKLVSGTKTETVTDPITGKKKVVVAQSPDQFNDPVFLFSRYAAGAMPKAGLKALVRQLQKKRDDVKSNLPVQWEVTYNGKFKVVVTARSERDAKHKAAQELGIGGDPLYVDLEDADYLDRMTAVIVTNKKQTSTQPQNQLPPHNPNGAYEIYNVQTPSNVYYGFDASNAQEALAIAKRWGQQPRISQNLSADEKELFFVRSASGPQVSGQNIFGSLVMPDTSAGSDSAPEFNPMGKYEVYLPDGTIVYRIEASDDTQAQLNFNTLKTMYANRSGDQAAANTLRIRRATGA